MQNPRYQVIIRLKETKEQWMQRVWACGNTELAPKLEQFCDSIKEARSYKCLVDDSVRSAFVLDTLKLEITEQWKHQDPPTELNYY